MSPHSWLFSHPESVRTFIYCIKRAIPLPFGRCPSINKRLSSPWICSSSLQICPSLKLAVYMPGLRHSTWFKSSLGNLQPDRRQEVGIAGPVEANRPPSVCHGLLCVGRKEPKSVTLGQCSVEYLESSRSRPCFPSSVLKWCQAYDWRDF